MLEQRHEIKARNKWVATQHGRTVSVRYLNGEFIENITPDKAWGNDWGWNISEDGNAIIINHPRK